MPEWSRVGGLEANAGGTRRKPPWLVLSLGFGGLLVFIVAAATGTLVVLDRVRHQETQIRQAFLQRLSALDQIRAQIYLSGTYVRDFLLSPDTSGAQAQTSRLAALERETHAALQGYSRILEAEEREPFRALQSEIEAYWGVLDRTVAWSPQQRDRLRYSFFYDELVPRRTAMLQIADRIAAVNERGLEPRRGTVGRFLRRSAPVFGPHVWNRAGQRPGAGAIDHWLHPPSRARVGTPPR